MALRLPGKGNFKPVRRPARPGPSQPSSSKPGPSQLTAEQPTVALKSQASHKPSTQEINAQELPPSLKPSTQELKTPPVPPSQPKPVVSPPQPPPSQPKPPVTQPKRSSPAPQASSPPPRSPPQSASEVQHNAAREADKDDPEVPDQHEKEEGASPQAHRLAHPPPPSRRIIGRPPKPRFTPTRQPAPKKAKALLLAAATAGPADPSSPRPIHHRRRGVTASVASTRDDDDIRMEDVSVPSEMHTADPDMPPTVAPVEEQLPDLPFPETDVPNVATAEASTSARSGRSPEDMTDIQTLAAAAVASIQPEGTSIGPGPRRKRRSRQPTTSETPAAPKRRRAAKNSANAHDDIDELEDEGLPEPTGYEDIPDRSRRAKSASRRPSGTPRQFAFSHPELDGVQEDGRVGDFEFNPAVATLSDLATISEGRVSARTIKLHQFTRAEEERKLRDRAERAEANWRRLQVVRRKARKLKNIARAQRRLEADRRHLDPADEVSDDSVDSEEEYEPMPDRLTPPGSPRATERVAPISFEPTAEDQEQPEEEGELQQLPADDEEDIEGLGISRAVVDEHEAEEEVGEELEDFQLPVEADAEGDGDEFSGLQVNEYGGGYLDDEGNWVENTENAGMVLQRRNEENRRRILEGDDDRQVEVIDNETQFINYSTWGKKVSNERWTPEETELFFDVLRETGENYTLMKAYFPGRNVRQLKKKGHRENKANPERMTECILGRRKTMDKEYLAKSAGFKITESYDREVEFLDEVAREKERLLTLGPVGEGEGEGEHDGQAAELNNLEFGVEAGV